MNWIDLPLAWFVIDMAICCGFTTHIIIYHRIKLLRHLLALRLQPLSLFAFPGLSNLMYM